MKFRKYLVILIAISFSSCMAQSKKDLIEKIDNDIKRLKAVMRLSDTKLMLVAGDGKFSPTDKSNFETDKANSGSDSTIHSFLKKLEVKSTTLYPYSMVAVYKDQFDLLKLMGEESNFFLKNPSMEPVFTPVKCTFLDGTLATPDYISKQSTAAKYKKTEIEDGAEYDFVDDEKMTAVEKYIFKSSGFDHTVALSSTKPLKSIQYNISFPKVKKTVIALSVAKPEAITPYGVIKLDKIVGHQVFCSLPDLEKENQISIQAYYKDGRILSEKGVSSNTEITPERRKLYLQYIDVLEKAKESVKNDEIKTEKELEKWAKKNAPAALADNGKKRKVVVYTFAGPVSAIDFLVSDSIPQIKNFEVTYTFNYNKEESQYFLASDFKSKKSGLINKEGKWVVQPQFNEHFRRQNRYYYWDQFDDDQNTYWLNHKTQKIQKVAYQVDDVEVYADKYVKIETADNGMKGIVNGLTGEIVVPMEYSYIGFDNGVWKGRKGEERGVFDKNFKFSYTK